MRIHKFFIYSTLSLGLLLGEEASAQFAVFDGASFGQLVQQLKQGVQMYNNAVQIYGVASQEASYLRNKQVLLAVGLLAQHAIIPGQPGWDKALTSAAGIANAGAVWNQMISPGGMNSLLAMTNRIKLADSFGSSTLNTIGNCNAAAVQTDGSISSLERMASDLNPAANTRANQANLNNMGQTQQLRIQECQHNLQLQQAKLQALQAITQREQDQRISNMRTADAAARSRLTVSDTANDIANVTDR